MWMNTYLLETLIREYMAEVEREAARRELLRRLEPAPTKSRWALIARRLRSAFPPRPSRRVERMAIR